MGIEQLTVDFKDETELDLFVDNPMVREEARKTYLSFEGAFCEQGYHEFNDDFFKQVYLPHMLNYEQERLYKWVEEK